MSLVDASKEAFVRTWGTAGYRENWDVYGKMSGHSEAQVVNACLAPFYDKAATVLEVGCGAGFWTDRYLAENFGRVIALDVIPRPAFQHRNINFIEVPDRNFDCYGVADQSVDFAWSFGVFCHMTLPSIERYLRGVFRALKPGGEAALYFPNIDRRPGVATVANTPDTLLWVLCDMPTTIAMLKRSGFVNISDLLPTLPDSMVRCQKPL